MLLLAVTEAVDGWEVEMQTFLVRVWTPADDRPCRPDLRGVVRHVATGVETTFRTGAELFHVLLLPLGTADDQPVSPSREESDDDRNPDPDPDPD